MLTSLEATRKLWSPDASVEFFTLWPERDEALNPWHYLFKLEALPGESRVAS